MKFGGDKPMDSYDPIGQQGFPMPPYGQAGPGASPGAIRNTLGSGLKASGFFQKDGQINNFRGGFIGPKQMPQQPMYPQQNGGYNPNIYSQNSGYPGGYGMGQSRQLILEAAQDGIVGNGVATISPDNSFVLIANLPAPQMILGQGQMGMYAAYLVEERGKSGFLAGALRPVGNGVYRLHFQSQVPLHHYDRAVVSVENPAQLGQAPNGPIILKVKEPMGAMAFLLPMKKAGSAVWGKFTGLFGRKKAPVVPEAAPVGPELSQPLNQTGVSPETMISPTSPIAPSQEVPQAAPLTNLPPLAQSVYNPINTPVGSSGNPTVPIQTSPYNPPPVPPVGPS